MGIPRRCRDHAEVVALVDENDIVRTISRNEEEALIRDVLGKPILYRIHPDHLERAQAALDTARSGEEIETFVSSIADDGLVYWSRARLTQSPLNESWVLIHARRLPRAWQLLSEREREVVRTLHQAGLNPKRAAKQLKITLNTLNAHRRSITQKCKLQGVGDFWVFVERCR